MAQRVLELLAPARTADIAIAAIDHGADAVYIGASHHGARHAAGNSVDDIRRVADYAHCFNARVYVTLNTLVYDNELRQVEILVNELYAAGADALIIQDMALLEMDLPPIAFHASTQCDISGPDRAGFLEDAGFSQLVLARELTLDEIRAVRRATTVPLEAFVHGALCVSYSGNCQASHVITGRSANRGECAQICRLPYDLIDGNGKCVVTGKHLLSLRDMNRLQWLDEMIDAGVDSFKIEGRLKDVSYVKTVVSVYSRELDRIVAGRSDLCRRSRGRVVRTFDAGLSDSFNRGYTDYFLHQRRPVERMASIDTPKSTGSPAGVVTRVNGRNIVVRNNVKLANGDGLTFFDAGGVLRGFRVNRVEGQTLHLQSEVEGLKPGIKLFRNRDIRREAMMERATARRVIDIDMTLRLASGGSLLVLDVAMAGNSTFEVSATMQLDTVLPVARTPQLKARRDVLAKLGNTVYEISNVYDRLGADVFVPLSALTALRREAISLFDRAMRIACQPELRRQPTVRPHLVNKRLEYSDNIANRLSEKFYRDAGAESIEPAIELSRAPYGTRVMLTRYGIRRELGCCLRTPEGRRLQGPLILRGRNFEFDLHFECARCEMSVHTRSPR